MPTISLAPRVRLILYLGAAVALLLVTYTVDKGWAGAAEVRLVAGVAALANVLAASKVDRADDSTETPGP